MNKSYIIVRLIHAVIVLFLVTALVFVIIHLLPGDPVLIYLSQEQYNRATPEEMEALRIQHGLDRPVYVQYFDWMGDLFHGDLGVSIYRNVSVNSLVGGALPISLYIGAISLVIGNTIAIPVGVICASRRNSWMDTTLTILANLGITAPTFLVGILMIYVFGVYLGWLPTHGYTSPFEDLALSLRKAILPIFCMTVFPLAITARQTRSAMLEVTHQDYIRTAWSKGLTEKMVLLRHAMKNGMLPVLTLIGTSVGVVVGGQVIIETVFGIPGMGSLAVEALLNRDYSIVQAVVLIVATVVVLSNLTVDILYGWLDPRVRWG